jgi:hypothetical protein
MAPVLQPPTQPNFPSPCISAFSPASAVKCYDYLPFGQELGNAVDGRPNCFGNSSSAYPTSPEWRLVWNALAENLLLAVIGGVAGIALASAGLKLLLRDTPVGLPRLSEVHLNLTVLLFSVVLIFGASIVSGLFPALRLLTTDPQVAITFMSKDAIAETQRKAQPKSNPYGTPQ